MGLYGRKAAAEQKARITGLRERANQLAGGKMVASTFDNCPPEIAEQFWKNMVAFEEAEEETLFDQLTRRGLVLPSPDELAEAALHSKLWEVIRALAEINTFLEFTDHLSDRQLYTQLWRDSLRVPEPVLDPAWGWNTHIDMSGVDDSDETARTYLKYYADDDEKAAWASGFPDFEIPASEDPPYDRDRNLPCAYAGTRKGDRQG